MGQWYTPDRSIYTNPVHNCQKKLIKVAKKLCTAPMPVQDEHKHILLEYTA